MHKIRGKGREKAVAAILLQGKIFEIVVEKSLKWWWRGGGREHKGP